MKTLPRSRVALFKRDERGAAMVEFAIVAPLLFVLVFGIIDYGRYFYWYARVTNAAREGARAGSVMKNLTGLDLAVRDTVMVRLAGSEVTTSMVTVETPPVGSDWTSRSTVAVTIDGYPFVQFTPFLPLPDALPTVRASFRHEYR
jgi:Flp pilus assembly protein TadG